MKFIYSLYWIIFFLIIYFTNRKVIFVSNCILLTCNNIKILLHFNIDVTNLINFYIIVKDVNINYD